MKTCNILLLLLLRCQVVVMEPSVYNNAVCLSVYYKRLVGDMQKTQLHAIMDSILQPFKGAPMVRRSAGILLPNALNLHRV